MPIYVPNKDRKREKALGIQNPFPFINFSFCFCYENRLWPKVSEHSELTLIL